MGDTDACLAKVKPGEPIFVLRSQDCLAPELVEIWAKKALGLGCPMEKVQEAKEVARTMRNWQTEHGSKCPD